MKTIPLTRGLVTTVDDQDFDYLNQWKWYAKISIIDAAKAYDIAAGNAFGEFARLNFP